MTAINLIVHSQAAYLVTDRAQYDGSGIVLQISSKIVLAPMLKAAIAYSGQANPQRIQEALQRLRISSQNELIGRLSSVASRLRYDNFATMEQVLDDGDVQLFLVIYSDERQRAEGYFVSTNQAYFPADYRPLSLCRIKCLISPPVDPAANPVDEVNFRSSHMVDLVLQQRSIGWYDGSYVGGGVDITKVCADGAERVTVATWPDVVGERIDVKRQPSYTVAA